MGTLAPDRDGFKRSAKNWEMQIILGLKYRKEFGFEDQWQVAKDYYRNKFKAGVFSVNEIFAQARSSIPRVYFRDPRVLITAPNHPEFMANAKVVEAIANENIRETKLKKELKRGALDAFLCNHAFIKTGYDSEFGFGNQPRSKEFEDSDLTEFDDDGHRIEYNFHVSPGMPWGMRVNPMHVVVPWGADRVSNARWIAFRFIRPLEDIQADRKYPSDVTKDLKPTQNPVQSKRDILSVLVKEGEYVAGWEIHDVRTGTVSVITDNSDKFLRDHEKDELQVEGLPCVEFLYNDDPDFFWGVPDAEIIKPQQLWINEINTLILKHVRLSILKIIAQGGAFEPEELDKLVSEEVKAVIETKSGKIPSDVIHIFQTSTPPDLKPLKDMVRQDIRTQLGFGENQLGNFSSSSRRTASEALIVQQASDIRSSERRDIMADALVDVVRRQNQYVFTFWTQKKVAQVVGADRLKYWVEFTGPEIRGEYTHKVDPEDSNPLSKMIRKRELLEIIKIMQTSGLPIQSLMRQLLFEYPGIDVDAIIPPPVGSNTRPMSLNDFKGSQNRFAQAQQKEAGAAQELVDRVIRTTAGPNGNA